MREPCKTASSVHTLENSLRPDVIYEFKIDNQLYHIIELTHYANHFKSPASLPYPSSASSEVGRFKVNDQWCAIVKVDSDSDAIELDLATLLTERELQIATLVASGRANKQIAHQLHISEWTVSTHLRRIFIKLGVDSRAAMVYRCAALIQHMREQLEPLLPGNSNCNPSV